MAVVLGLLLRGDRLAPLRAARGRGPSWRRLLAAQRPDGFIGHTIFWAPPGLRPAPRLLQRRLAPARFQTETIQPPLLAWAWRIAVGDPAAEPRIAAQAEWLAANRDLDGDGLLWIVQPDESGLDASPKFDPVWGRRANGRLGFPLLVRRNRRLGFDARRIRDAGGPVLCEVLVNTMLVALAAGARPPLGDAGAGRAALGRAPRPLRRRGPAGRPRPAPLDLGLAGAAGAARPAGGDRPPPGRGAPARTARSSSPRWRRPRSPPPSASYEPGGGRGPIRRYWRGPTWVNSAWLVWLGLRRLGYEEEARAPRRRRPRRRRPRRPARVLRPAHGQGPRRQGLRLVGARSPSWPIPDPT